MARAVRSPCFLGSSRSRGGLCRPAVVRLAHACNRGDRWARFGQVHGGGALPRARAHVVDLDEVAAQACSRRDRALLERVAEAFGDDEILLAGRPARPGGACARRRSRRRRQRGGSNAIVHPAVARDVGVATRAAAPAAGAAARRRARGARCSSRRPCSPSSPTSCSRSSRPRQCASARAVARGMDRGGRARRMRAQATDEERATLADVVIVNDGALERVPRRARRVLGASTSRRGVAR